MAPPRKKPRQRRTRSTRSGADIETLNVTFNHFLGMAPRSWMPPDDRSDDRYKFRRSPHQRDQALQASRKGENVVTIRRPERATDVITIDSEDDDEKFQPATKSERSLSEATTSSGTRHRAFGDMNRTERHPENLSKNITGCSAMPAVKNGNEQPLPNVSPVLLLDSPILPNVLVPPKPLQNRNSYDILTNPSERASGARDFNSRIEEIQTQFLSSDDVNRRVSLVRSAVLHEDLLWQ